MSTTEQEAHDRADMAQLVAGRDASLNDLMDRHAEPIFRFLYRMLANEDDARDLAQETFVRVYRARDTFRAERKFSTWLYTIAGNLARNHLRWRARHPAVSMDAQKDETGSGLGDVLISSTPTPERQLEDQERVAAVRLAVERLPQELREALILCEWEELSMAEAAEVLKTTIKAVDSRLYRARKQLRQSLGRWLDT